MNCKSMGSLLHAVYFLSLRTMIIMTIMTIAIQMLCLIVAENIKTHHFFISEKFVEYRQHSCFLIMHLVTHMYYNSRW